MNRSRAFALLFALLLPAAGPRLAAQGPPPPDAPPPLGEPDQELGEAPERYAQAKVVEGDVVLRKGEANEALTRGIPVGEGDIVDSRGRGVLQLGDGSRVAFGPDTRFKIAALFSDRDEARRVLLVLEQGEIRIRKGTHSDAILRVDTPSGSATLGNRGNPETRPEATLQATSDDRGARTILLVHGGQAGFANGTGRTQVFAGQRLTVYGGDDALDRVSDFSTFGMDDFDGWAEALVRPGPSESAARVPEEIRYYADDLDSAGTWSYVDENGTWCWSPSGVPDDWRPYSDGCWGAFGGGLTWIAFQPWGFVTGHFGRWGWGPRLGWYWIPGIYYSPAWVAWGYAGGCLGWAPLGYHNRPCRWGYGPWAGGPCWNVVAVGDLHRFDLHRHFRFDPGTLRTFNEPGGIRLRGRLPVTRAEFGDPARFQQIMAQPGALKDRVAAYARTAQASTGRTLRFARTAPDAAFDRLERPGDPAQPPRSVFLAGGRGSSQGGSAAGIRRSGEPAPDRFQGGAALRRDDGTPPPRYLGDGGGGGRPRDAAGAQGSRSSAEDRGPRPAPGGGGRGQGPGGGGRGPGPAQGSGGHFQSPGGHAPSGAQMRSQPAPAHEGNKK